jgi:hypothetical protein
MTQTETTAPANDHDDLVWFDLSAPGPWDNAYGG